MRKNRDTRVLTAVLSNAQFAVWVRVHFVPGWVTHTRYYIGAGKETREMKKRREKRENNGGQKAKSFGFPRS